jgi:hypothetical protein
LGGAGFEGHFSNKKVHLKIFPGNVGNGGGDVISKKFSAHTKKLSGYIRFFPKYEKKFPDTPKNFQDILNFSRK